jgi:siderophore-iron reductase FhuF
MVMTKEFNSRNTFNFLENVFKLAQVQLDSLYTDSLFIAQPPDYNNIISSSEYLDPKNLLSLLESSYQYQASQNLKAAASVWNKFYSWVTLPGILALMTWGGIGLDASLDNISFVFEKDEIKGIWFHDISRTIIYPQRLPIPIPHNYPGKLAHTVEELHQFVFTGLFERHLIPLIESLHNLTKLSKKTMWGNAVNACERHFDELRGYASEQAISKDYSVLFEESYSSITSNRNPLYNLLRIEQINQPDLLDKLAVRKTCCLYAIIPPDYRKCNNCPLLTPEERIAQMKAEMLVDE